MKGPPSYPGADVMRRLPLPSAFITQMSGLRTASGAVETGHFAGLTDDGFLRLAQGTTERVVSGGDVIES